MLVILVAPSRLVLERGAVVADPSNSNPSSPMLSRISMTQHCETVKEKRLQTITSPDLYLCQSISQYFVNTK